MSAEKRWLLIKPDTETGCSVLLAKACGDVQKAYIDNQTGGRVFLFLKTVNFQRDYDKMLEKGINFVRKPRRNGCSF